MDIICDSFPQPTDDFGVLWALSGIKDAAIIEHGPTGTTYFHSVVNFGAINRQYPKGTIFTTGLNEEDVVMGNEMKLVKAVKEVDELYHPEMISLVATAVTSLIGIDLEAVVRELQPDVKAKLFAFTGGGFQGSYIYGIKDVFRTLIKELVVEPEVRSGTGVNIIGQTVDSFNHPSDMAELVRLLGLLDVKVNTVFTNTTSVKNIKSAANAVLNVVTRDTGVEAAQILEERFNIPYCYGLPFGIRGTVEWLEIVGQSLGKEISSQVVAEQVKQYGLTLNEVTSNIWRQDFRHLRVAISCPYDYALGLTRFVQEDLGLRVVLVCLPVEPEIPGATEVLRKRGVPEILVAADSETIQAALHETRPHILFGGADISQMAKDVSVHIRAALPSHDYLCIYDGTPFIGFRGALYLTQTLVNLVNRNKEILV
jgi:light-independent protochlorophyllide reductase B subunit